MIKKGGLVSISYAKIVSNAVFFFGMRKRLKLIAELTSFGGIDV